MEWSMSSNAVIEANCGTKISKSLKFFILLSSNNEWTIVNTSGYDRQKLFLLDAYALIYRAYYALIRAPAHRRDEHICYIRLCQYSRRGSEKGESIAYCGVLLIRRARLSVMRCMRASKAQREKAAGGYHTLGAIYKRYNPRIRHTGGRSAGI